MTLTGVITKPESPAHLSSHIPRVLVWDGNNSSSVAVARSFARQGWAVDWLGVASSPWRRAEIWNTRRIIAGYEDAALERVFAEHPLDALSLHGDDQVRWLLARRQRLSESVLAHLPAADALEIALSKLRSAELARRLGVPVLETTVCRSRAEVAEAGTHLGRASHVVVKGEGGAAGSGVVAVRAGQPPSDEQWHRVTALVPTVMVQKRIDGPRMLVTVAYARGIELAACMHEKITTFPHEFGAAALGITRRVDVVHEHTAKMFGALAWHGIADIEFRQDLDDGRWYFMEINPRVCATLGIEVHAGMDLVGAWVRACAGLDAEDPPGRAYREGVSYVWGVRALARLMQRPWAVRPRELQALFSPACDLHPLASSLRCRALHHAFWMARHG